jgi:hypothetical protein
MGNDQPALCALFACESGPFRTGNRAGAHVRSFLWQKKDDKWVEWQNLHDSQFAKTTANCSNSFCHFHLILSVRPNKNNSWFQVSDRPVKNMTDHKHFIDISQ